MTKAESMNVRFKVHEWVDGTPYLAPLECGPTGNSILNDKNLFSIHLKEGTTHDDALSLARHLNEHASKLGLRSFRSYLRADLAIFCLYR